MTRHRSRRTAVTRRLLATIILGANLVGSLSAVALVSAADSSADIPGIPLPGPVAAGRLGGAIYDVVYRVQVPPGYVIVASLTGAAETDFDLYLFDASATTVLSKTGLLRESIGPTSTESLTWPSRLGGTYYLDLNGATDIEGDYRLAVQMIPDQTPPAVTIVLAGGRGSTNQLIVPVSLRASDDLSGVIEMAFSSDGATYTPWQSFDPSATWTFEPGDGPRMLWAKVKNGVGLESAPRSAQITIDTLAPTILSVSPPRNSIVVGLRPKLSVVFDEPVDPASWADLGLIVQASDGRLVLGTYAYDVVTRTGSFIPAGPMTAGGLYLVTVGGVRDVAGNNVSSNGSWTIIPTIPADLDATVTPRVVPRGGSAAIDVTLSGAPPDATVGLEAAPATVGSYAGLATLSLTNGYSSITVNPVANTTYRLRYAGTAAVAPAQRLVQLLVRRGVVLPGRSSSVTASARVERAVTLTAMIDPATQGVSVSFRLYRYDQTRRTWIYTGSHGKSTDSSGRASYKWTPTARGTYYWRVSVASTSEFANNVSPVYRWAVSR